MLALSPSACAWRERGKRVRAAGHELFVVDTPGRAGATPVVLLHGFPTSSLDWHRCVDALAVDRRVVTFDLLGLGWSDKPAGHGYSLVEQADLALVLLRELGIPRAHLVAHEMGTSGATELVARRARGLSSLDLASLTLTNGSVYVEMAHLTPSQRLLRVPLLGSLFARASRYPLFRAQVRRTLGRPLPEAELSDMFLLVERDGGKARLAEIIGYVSERRRFASRWNDPLRRFDRPALVVWGALDPVAVLAIGERLAREIPGARLVRLDDVGHFTPLEAPDELTREIGPFLREVDERDARSEGAPLAAEEPGTRLD